VVPIDIKLRVAEINALCLILMMLSGNAMLAGLDMFFCVAGVSLFYGLRFSERSSISPMIVIVGISIVLICLALTYFASNVDVPYLQFYYLWPIKFALMMIFGLLMGSFDFGRLAYVLLLSLSVVTLLTGSFENGRLDSFFGPNMLYRIYALLVFYSIFGYKHLFLNRLYCGLGVAFGLWLTLLTGSVGGIATVLATFFLSGVFKFNFRHLLFLIICALILFSLPELLPLRVAYKIENFDTVGRIVNWINILEHFEVFKFYIHSDFNDIWSYGFMYPHNIFIELSIFYGVFGYLLVVLVTLAVFKERGSPIHVMLCVYLMGSLLSGDLSDNFPVLALAVLILLRHEKFNWVIFNYKRLK